MLFIDYLNYTTESSFANKKAMHSHDFLYIRKSTTHASPDYTPLPTYSD